MRAQGWQSDESAQGSQPFTTRPTDNIIYTKQASVHTSDQTNSMFVEAIATLFETGTDSDEMNSESAEANTKSVESRPMGRNLPSIGRVWSKPIHVWIKAIKSVELSQKIDRTQHNFGRILSDGAALNSHRSHHH